MEHGVSVELPHVVVIAPAAVAAIRYIIKHTCALDLELRVYRVRLQNELEAARRAGADAASIEFLTTRPPRWYQVRDRRRMRQWLSSYGVDDVRTVTVPGWALAFLDASEAERCSVEWGSHLHQRIAEGETREARADRRRFVRLALRLAVTRHLSRAVSRSR